MSNASIGIVRLPNIVKHWRGGQFARRTVLHLFSHLDTGSLTLIEGEKTFHYGAEDTSESLSAVVNIHDSRVYQALIMGGTVGAGEAYMQGYWSSPDLVKLIQLFSANMKTMDSMEAKSSFWRNLGQKLWHGLNGNSITGSRRNICAHYDLGNEFFDLFLTPDMMYSSAVFANATDSLEQASEHKLELLCQQLQLTPDDHLLEIGTGWGGMAIYAASNYGCKVTTTTISNEQFDYARNLVAELGLGEQITVLCEDYRKLTGQYDKLVSVEMIEAVGHEYYGAYFSKCSDLLKADGLMAIQAITVADQRFIAARDAVDFIKRYIFPGGCLPSVEVIAKHLSKDTDMQMIHLKDITADYALTLMHWRERFLQQLPTVREQGFDDVFVRMWEFYLAYCEGGFRERIISTVQLTFAKPGHRA